MWYKFSIDRYESDTDSEKKVTGLVKAPTFSDAARQITEDYGDAYVDTLELIRIEHEYNCLSIEEIISYFAEEAGNGLPQEVIAQLIKDAKEAP